MIFYGDIGYQSTARKQVTRTTAPATPAPPPLWLLTLVSFSGTPAMHIFVPALPCGSGRSRASAAAVRKTVTFYLRGFLAVS